MKRKTWQGWLIALPVILAVLVLLAYMIFYQLPYLRARNAMAAETYFTLTAQDRGETRLVWTGTDCDGYAVTVQRPGDSEPLWQCDAGTPECLLPDLGTDETLELQVNSWRQFSRLGKTERRMGAAPALLCCSLAAPEVSELTLEPDPAANAAALRWTAGAGCTVALQAGLGEETWDLGDQTGAALALRFDGGAEALPMPAHGETYVFQARAYRTGENYLFQGARPAEATLEREDLLGRDLALECSELGDNRYRLTWAETKGQVYLVQQQNETGVWETLKEIGQAGARCYDTRRYAPFTRPRLRVVAQGGDTLPESDFATEPAELELQTRESVRYAAVWPLKDLELYADPARETVLATVPAAACCCALGEQDGLLRVRWAEFEGYLDAVYCLINLPDYIGGLCAYDITNSYESLYMIHEFEIPKVTATVVAGYDHVELEPGDYLVPLLYPTAKKLIPAAQAALADGCRLKIYDSYRPNRATRSIYDLALAIINDPLPEKPFTDTPLAELELPAPAEEGGDVTYLQLVTNGVYSLANFLASQGSYHNMGIAMDLTLERADNGEELEMQTRMHDLSCYSILTRNNNNANRLFNYMHGAGFNGLTSEWWHFQDDGTRIDNDLHIFMWGGVSPEGWTADERGWRYRAADGSFRRDWTLQLGENTYRFDGEGYLIEEE